MAEGREHLLQELELVVEAARRAACRVYGEQMGNPPGYYETLSEIAKTWQSWHDNGGSDRLYAALGRPTPWSAEGRQQWRDQQKTLKSPDSLQRQALEDLTKITEALGLHDDTTEKHDGLKDRSKEQCMCDGGGSIMHCRSSKCTSG